jgi:MFS family permease
MLSALWWVLFGPLWGRRSDRVGRKPIIMTGLTAFAISMFAFASVLHFGVEGALSGVALYALLILTRSIYGVIGSATPGAAQGYIADRTSADERTGGMAAFSAAFGIGAMTGPAFAGALVAFDPLAPLYAVSAAAALSVLAVWRFLPEKTPPRERAQIAARLSPFDRRIRPFLAYGVATGLITAIPVQFIAFFMIDRMGLDRRQTLEYVGVALSASAMAALFAQLVLVQRFRLEPSLLMRVGPIVLCVGHAIVAFSSALGPIVFGMMLSGLGAGMLTPGYIGGASLSVGNDEQGSAAGLSNAAGASGFILAPIIGQALYQLGPPALFIGTAVVAAFCALYAVIEKGLARPVAKPAEPDYPL